MRGAKHRSNEKEKATWEKSYLFRWRVRKSVDILIDFDARQTHRQPYRMKTKEGSHWKGAVENFQGFW